MVTQETILQQHIVSLRTRLLLMCAAVSVAVEDMVHAFETRDVGRAAAVIDGDNDIDALENEIDDKALKLMACTQPVAGDLRFVVSALRMVLDLERIGDEASSMAEGCILLQDMPPYVIMDEVQVFLHQSRNAYEQAVAAFRSNDIAAALALARTEDDATQGEVRLLHRCMQAVLAHEVDEQAFMHIVLIIRAATRIWRRSANIAEHVYFSLHGDSLKHCPK